MAELYISIILIAIFNNTEAASGKMNDRQKDEDLPAAEQEESSTGQESQVIEKPEPDGGL